MSRVKPLLLLALFVIVALIGYHFVGNRENAGPASRKTLPVERFYDRDARETGVEAYLGKVVLVNLWATWCTPCVAELPSLERLQAKFEAQGLQVVPICLDSKSDAAACEFFLRDKKITQLFSWWDKSHVAVGDWNYQGVPTSLLLDRKGGIIKVFEGPIIWDEPDAQADITAALAEH